VTSSITHLQLARMMTEAQRARGGRPAVSVIVPFAGGRAQAAALLVALGGLRLRDGDEVIVADNNPIPVVPATHAVRVVHAPGQRSSYYARNRGAEEAGAEWLLFVDADCVPSPTLPDDYFEPAPKARTGAVAGAVLATPGTTAPERWAASRQPLGGRAATAPGGPAAVTANLLVRRAAWAAVGGFCEGVRSGADLELCWRLGDAGWGLEWRPGATVAHRARGTLRGLLRQMGRYGAGNAWQNRRRRGASPAPRMLAALPRMLGGAARRAAGGRLDSAGLSAIDAAALGANSLGRLGGNAGSRAPLVADGRRAVAIFVDRFPVLSESFVAGEARALSRLGWRVRIEAAARPERPVLGGAREWRVDYLEDEGALGRAVALAWLLARHPLRAAVDLAGRRGWPPGERLALRGLAPLALRLSRAGDEHVHVHFAGPAATHALRAGRLAGVPVSVAAHAYDIYRSPSALPRKLDRSAFVAADCEYTRRDLAAMLAPRDRGKVHRIVMGVDRERFHRTRSHPDDGPVAAIGRYVEKKGFGDLIDAAALLRADRPELRVVIAGDGPLRGELERRARELDLDGVVELRDAWGHEAVRDLLERSSVLAMPSVIAPDGDRDSMPVVVKEALAMEVPVVATDEVGLAELVRPEWGRLVPPGDDRALAAAIAELLAMSPDERAAMGRAGREFVLEHCDLGREAQRLADLISACPPVGDPTSG
jgi:glycosyltransferase involved in cell wall biosynthesis/GT2 family glycosyltransferase